jgi:hypothetical protein
VLAAEGALRGSRIGVRSGDPLGVIEVIAARAWLGAVAVPLDPDSDPDLLCDMVAGAGLRLVKVPGPVLTGPRGRGPYLGTAGGALLGVRAHRRDLRAAQPAADRS